MRNPAVTLSDSVPAGGYRKVGFTVSGLLCESAPVRYSTRGLSEPCASIGSPPYESVASDTGSRRESLRYAVTNVPNAASSAAAMYMHTCGRISRHLQHVCAWRLACARWG